MFKKTISVLGIIALTFLSTSITVYVKESHFLLQDKVRIKENVEAKKFKQLIDNQVGTILDVRTAGEFNSGYIDGAVNIDYYSKSFKTELAKLDKNKPVFVYCKSGGRSSKAMNIMNEMGFLNVYNLLGGYSNWPYK
jgi:rhodanese-related sulfurtransferase